MRLVLVTGKGGVGKTTLAAATAVSAAKRGARTLVVSTDAAHSLGDVLAAPLSGDPVTVSPGLDALHLDGRRELERSWLAISDYLRRLIGWADIDRLHVDELMVVPGLDQLLALARLRSLAEQGRWDAIIVDCAPSADSLRLLTLPDVLRWYVDRVFGSNGVIGGWARRRVQRGLSIPMPGDEVFDSVADLTDQLQRLQELLTQAVTTARIVVTPERVVVAEAQRTLAYLALYGYAVDAVLVNRLLGPELAVPELQQWRNAQDAQILAIDQAFAPLPRLTAEYRQFEPIGIHALSELGREVYDGFEAAIKDREGRGETVETRFVSIDGADLIGAEMRGKTAQVTVRFQSQLVSVTRDKTGNVIDGNPDKVTDVTDVWTFARDASSRDPNWKLVATEAGQ